MSDKIIKSRIGLRILQVLLIAVLLYFIGSRIVSNWGEISDHEWHVNYALLVLSLLVMLLALGVMSSVLSRIIACFGKEISYTKAFKIAYLSQLGRYIPGKIWQVPAMVYLAGKEGVGKGEAVTAFALAQLFATSPAILVAVPMLLFSGGAVGESIDLRAVGYMLALVVIVSIAILLKPEWLSRLMNFVLKKLGKDSVEFRVEKKSGGLILLMYYIGWNLYGLAFYLFLISVSGFPTGHFLQASGIFCVAYLIGYWSIFAPGGIGVREVVLVVLLSPYLGPGMSAAVAAAARLWSIVGELIASAIAWRVK